MASSSSTLLFSAIVFAGIVLTRTDFSMNRTAPPFSLPESYGGQVDLASYAGRPVLLVFWATSCGICRHELPLLSQLAPELRSQGLDVLLIDIGGGDDVNEYISTNHIRLTSVVDADGTVAQAYRVSAIPKMVLVGADGLIKRTSVGGAGEDTLRDWARSAGGS